MQATKLLFTKTSPFPAILPLSLAALYLLFSYNAMNRAKGDKGLILTYIGLCTLFVTLAIPAQFKDAWMGLAWAMESVVLLWIGFRLKNPRVRLIGILVLILSIVRLVGMDYQLQLRGNDLMPFLFNARMASYAALSLCLFLVASFYRRSKNETGESEKDIATLLIILAHVFLVLEFSNQARIYFSNMALQQTLQAGFPQGSPQFWPEFRKASRNFFGARELSVSAVWIVYALGSLIAGMRFRIRSIRVMGLALFGIAVLKIFFIDLSTLDKIYRILSFMGLGVMLLVASFFYQKNKDGIRNFTTKD